MWILTLNKWVFKSHPILTTFEDFVLVLLTIFKITNINNVDTYIICYIVHKIVCQNSHNAHLNKVVRNNNRI